jgi:hypothetical protein
MASKKVVLAVIQVIISSEFCMNVAVFLRVEVCTFLLVVEDMRRVGYVAEGLCLFQEVLGAL